MPPIAQTQLGARTPQVTHNRNIVFPPPASRLQTAESSYKIQDTSSEEGPWTANTYTHAGTPSRPCRPITRHHSKKQEGRAERDKTTK